MLNRCGWVLWVFYPEGEAGSETEVRSPVGPGNLIHHRGTGTQKGKLIKAIVEARASSSVLAVSPKPTVFKGTLHQTCPYRISKHILNPSPLILNFSHGAVERLFLPHSTFTS